MSAVLRVTFDMNVFSHIVNPAGCHDPELERICGKICSAIEDGRIQAYFSETIFNLEAIARELRASYFGDYRPSVLVEEQPANEPGVCHSRICIGPELSNFPETDPLMEGKLENARALGFTLLSAPRFGMPRNPLLTKSDFGDRNPDEITQQQTIFFEAVDFVSTLGSGSEFAKRIANKVRTTEAVWHEALKRTSKAQASRAIGEWADGDAVAAHISYGLDYFCTRDKAKSAGSKSVFSKENRAKLTEQFGISFINPSDLVELIGKSQE
jgi:hypothetical protein